jgi:2,3-bisphosphoglycerate-dependent phosphoglycerate mutase
VAKLILLRHGESAWNQKNLFTGWVDIPLSRKGIEESLDSGKKIKDIPIDIVFTSTLVRAQETAFIALAEHSSGKVPVVLHTGEGLMEEWSQIYGEKAAGLTIPVVRASELNERMYGELQGLDKDETRAKFGVDQVLIWRRSYDIPPPHGESLEMTAARSIPFFEDHIVPQLQLGKNVLVCAHGNSLRSIVMQMDGLSKEEVLKLEIATGVPLFYDYTNGAFAR